MSNASPRPAGVTVVVFLTWFVAIMSILGGALFLLASDAALEEAEIAANTATTYGWIEIAFGVITALVAVGLGNGNNFSRLLTTGLMGLRLAGSLWAAVALSGHTGFWAAVGGAVTALVILVLLWNNKANMFFATH